MKRTMPEVTDEQVAQVVRIVAGENYGADEETIGWLTGLTIRLRNDARKASEGMTPIEFIRSVLEGVDGVGTGLLAPHVRHVEEALGQKVACRVGCVACCDYSVNTTGIEADRIAARVMLMPEDQRREILGRIAEGMRRGLDQLDPRARLAERFACPLLIDQKCSVYDERPIACRAWFGLSEEQCASIDESSPFGLLALIGDVASFALDLTIEASKHEAGDLIALLAERLNV